MIGRLVFRFVAEDVLTNSTAYGIFSTLICLIMLQIFRESMDKSPIYRYLMVMTLGGLAGWIFAISMHSRIYSPEDPLIFGLGVFFLVGTILLGKEFFSK